VILVVAGCASSTLSSTDVDDTSISRNLSALLAFGPRPSETQSSRDAAAYIARQLRSVGIIVEATPLGNVELPEVRVLGRLYRQRIATSSTDVNVVARFGAAATATQPALLLMAHYDSVTDSPGAADNAAAVAVLLELCAHLHKQPPAFPVIVAFTAREEDGLIGAEMLARDGGNLVGFAIALDIVGLDGALTLNGASNLIRRAELTYLADVSNRAGVSLDLPATHRIVSRWWPQAERSDHGPFTRLGIRAVHFYHRGSNGELIDTAYHSPFDIGARIDASKLLEVASLLRVIVTTPPPGVRQFSEPAGSGDAGWWIPSVMGTWVAPRRLLIACCITVIAATLLLLFSRRRSSATTTPSVFGLIAAVIVFTASVSVAVVIEGLATYQGAWSQSPRRSISAACLLISGLVVVIAMGLHRFWSWNGERRFLYAAVGIHLTVGTAAIILGAAEIAPLWLGAALLLALAPSFGRATVFMVALSAYPLWFVLDPNRLREMMFHQFMPPGLPLSMWVAFHLAPLLLACAYIVRRKVTFRAPGPLASFAIPTLGVLAILVGSGLWVFAHPTCSFERFSAHGLMCERGNMETISPP
jgi:hypothetical protein